MNATADACRYCNSTDLITVVCERPSPHHARTSCKRCGRHLRYEAAPMTPERAAAFVLPFGKHSGAAVGQVASTAAGRSYLAWMAAQETMAPGVVRAIDFHLAGLAEAPR